MTLRPEPASFRDRDGFVFYRNDSVLRAIHPQYIATWEKVIASGVFARLQQHERAVGWEPAGDEPAYPGFRVIRAERVPFVSYPYEWSFTQLKAAAVLTLDLHLAALSHNLVLKDASGFNVLAHGSAMKFIDLLSLDAYSEGAPWQAYGQFCRHFLAPLLLMSHGRSEWRALFMKHIDGVPLDSCAQLLPYKSRFSFSTYTHIHLHASLTRKAAGKPAGRKLRMPRSRLEAMAQHLRGVVSGLSARRATNWTDYYDTCTYTDASMAAKEAFVTATAERCSGARCVDLGANTGRFSHLVSPFFRSVISCDADEEVVNQVAEKAAKNMTALCIDLAAPTPPLGWAGRERMSFLERVQDSDLVLALALVHHLCIGNNVPLGALAAMLSEMGRQLVIEWVPKSDPQAERLMVCRRDVFADYTLEAFREAFGRLFTLEREQQLPGSARILFHFKRR